MDETSTQEKQTPDTPEESPSQTPPDAPRQTDDRTAAQGKHPDTPEHPTTPYDHIWYERRPLH